MRALARLLVVLGTAGAVIGTSKLHAQANTYDYSGSFRFAWSLAFVLLLVVASYGAGLPDLVRTKRHALQSTATVLFTGAAGMSALQLVVGDALLPRFVVGASTLVLLPWYVLCAALARRGWARQELRDRVLLVGSHEDAEILRKDLQTDAEFPAVLVASLLPTEIDGHGVAEQRLLSAVQETKATVIVLAREALAHELIVHQAGHLHEQGLRIRTLSLFYEQWLGKLPVPELERTSLFYDISEVHRALYGRISRIMDVALSSIGMVVFAVVIPFVLLGNLVANRGPIFYRQPRVGKNGHEFSILKFRTMRQTDAGRPNEWTTEDDPRITPFGRVLRRTHVDEIPQLLNIVRGDLSLVGPRPEQPHYVLELKEKLPFYDLRHLVRPGLTGWAQVKYGYAGTESDALQKLQYEFYYLRHQSLSLDLKILFRTVRSVLGARGR